MEQLLVEVGVQEGLDGHRDFLDIFGLRKDNGDNLLYQLPSAEVLLGENLSPEILALSLDKILRLQSEEPVVLGQLEDLLVAGPWVSVVGQEGEEGVPLLSVGTDDLGIVIEVLREELLWVLIVVNGYLGQTVMDATELAALGPPLLEPLL